MSMNQINYFRGEQVTGQNCMLEWSQGLIITFIFIAGKSSINQSHAKINYQSGVHIKFWTPLSL